jgi:GNAT superfamily N-acetyltransferase
MTPVVRLLSPDEVRVLRSGVLRLEGSASGSADPKADHPDTLHLGAEFGGEVVCLATIFPEALPGDTGAAWRLIGMMTRPDMQRRGYGRAVVERCIECVRERGGAYLWCNSRLEATGFYRKLGFSTRGQPFPVMGRGLRIRMVCHLDRPMRGSPVTSEETGTQPYESE